MTDERNTRTTPTIPEVLDEEVIGAVQTEAVSEPSPEAVPEPSPVTSPETVSEAVSSPDAVSKAVSEPSPEALSEASAAETVSESVALPHDALVHLLSYLSTRQLLQARLVCRRWRDASLDPDVWRRRSLVDGEDIRVFTAMLRLAPCLRKLSIHCETPHLGVVRKEAIVQVCSTRCAVEKLRVVFDDAGAGFAALIICNQGALGRLRRLHVERCEFRETGGAPSAMLLDVVCRLPGLVELDFWRDSCNYLTFELSLPPPGVAVPASLRVLVDAPWVLPAHLAFLLRCHAPTLERVGLHSDLLAVDGPGALLSRAANLAELSCGLMEDMARLLQCPRLARLTIDVTDAPRTAFRAANEYLRRAAPLRHVTFRHFDSLEGRRADLIRALGTAEHAAVETLTVLLLHEENDYARVDMTDRFVSAFADALPWLTALREVHLVGDPIDGFLEALSPVSAPSLRLLRVHMEHDYPSEPLPACAHSLLHRAALRDALARHPALHVRVVSMYADCYDRHEPCLACGRGCHAVLHERFLEEDEYWDSNEEKVITLYGHAEDAACDVAHGSADDENAFAFALADLLAPDPAPGSVPAPAPQTLE